MTAIGDFLIVAATVLGLYCKISVAILFFSVIPFTCSGIIEVTLFLDCFIAEAAVLHIGALGSVVSSGQSAFYCYNSVVAFLSCLVLNDILKSFNLLTVRQKVD